MQERVQHVHTAMPEMKACSHSPVCSIWIAYHTITSWDGSQSDAGFQWQVERQIRSGGRLWALLSVVENKSLCLELTNQEIEPCTCIIPFHYKSSWNGKWVSWCWRLVLHVHWWSEKPNQHAKTNKEREKATVKIVPHSIPHLKYLYSVQEHHK